MAVIVFVVGCGGTVSTISTWVRVAGLHLSITIFACVSNNTVTHIVINLVGTVTMDTGVQHTVIDVDLTVLSYKTENILKIRSWNKDESVPSFIIVL